jgi:hypothetical protein
VPSSPLGPVVLLVVALAGCGGGGGGTAAGVKAVDPTAGVEDETAAAKKAQPGKPAPKPVAAPKIDESMIPEQPGAPLARESYSYTGGRRDPFASVLETANAGPELPDLTLVAIVYIERAPATSAAVLRDKISGKRYTVREGDHLGRMRIASIRPKDVTFTIDDYGTERQETVTLRKLEVK